MDGIFKGTDATVVKARGRHVSAVRCQSGSTKQRSIQLILQRTVARCSLPQTTAAVSHSIKRSRQFIEVRQILLDR